MHEERHRPNLRRSVRLGRRSEATVTLVVEPNPGGCKITIEEHASAGPAQLVPKPVMDAVLHARNDETLKRLTMIAEGRTSVDPTRDVG